MSENITERFLRAKELAARLAAEGIEPASYEYVLEVIRVAPTAVGRTMRYSDLIAFMQKHGTYFRPFSRHEERRSGLVSKRPIQSELPGILTL